MAQSAQSGIWGLNALRHHPKTFFAQVVEHPAEDSGHNDRPADQGRCGRNFADPDPSPKRSHRRLHGSDQCRERRRDQGRTNDVEHHAECHRNQPKPGCHQILAGGQVKQMTRERQCDDRVVSDECEPVSICPTQRGYQATRRPRHSASAAARLALKLSRLVRARSPLKWLWIEEWTATNFWSDRIRRKRSMARSRRRKG